MDDIAHPWMKTCNDSGVLIPIMLLNEELNPTIGHPLSSRQLSCPCFARSLQCLLVVCQ